MVIATTTNALPPTSMSGLTWALTLPVSMRKTPPSPTWLWSEDDYQCVCQLFDNATTQWGSKTLPSTCLPCRPGSCPSPDFKICMLRHRIATMAKQWNTTWVRLAWSPFLPLASTSTTLPGSPLQMYRLLIPPEKSDLLPSSNFWSWDQQHRHQLNHDHNLLQLTAHQGDVLLHYRRSALAVNASRFRPS